VKPSLLQNLPTDDPAPINFGSWLLYDDLVDAMRVSWYGLLEFSRWFPWPFINLMP